MNKLQSPAIVPDNIRPKDPEPDPIVETMGINFRGHVDPKAIRIDANWGVWIDPKAKVAFSSDPSNTSPPPAPVQIDRLEDGYTVYLTNAVRSKRYVLKRELHTSFRDYIPASKVV